MTESDRVGLGRRVGWLLGGWRPYEPKSRAGKVAYWACLLACVLFVSHVSREYGILWLALVVPLGLGLKAVAVHFDRRAGYEIAGPRP